MDERLQKAIANQFAAFGLPPGSRAPNAQRAAGLELLAARRRSLAGVARLKDERGEDWGFAALAIPELDYAVLRAKNPELDAKDAETRNRAWHKLIRDYGHVYGVDDSIGKRRNPNGIIVK
jgi:hypothetical protein